MRRLAVLALVILGGCASLVPRIEQDREVGEFDRVWVMGSAHVRVELGRVYGATVVANREYQSAVRVQVTEGALVISRKSGSPIPGGVDVRVRVPYLTAISIQGSAELEIDGVSGPDFEVQLQGSGSVRASGEVDLLRVELLGSGDIDLTRLHCKDARVRLVGSGDVEVSPSVRLVAVVEGSGDVTYSGPETLELQVEGDVTRR